MLMSNLKKAVGIAGITVGAAYLWNKANKSKLEQRRKPADLQDSDMVEEGALTSVQYYNELQEKRQKEAE